MIAWLALAVATAAIGLLALDRAPRRVWLRFFPPRPRPTNVGWLLDQMQRELEEVLDRACVPPCSLHKLPLEETGDGLVITFGHSCGGRVAVWSVDEGRVKVIASARSRGLSG